MKSYWNFWETLAHAYPISKWTLRLPIATRYLDIKDINIHNYFQDFQSIVSQLIDTIDKEWREQIAIKNWQPEITPFLGKDFSGVIRFDCMLNKNCELKVIEVNSDYPDWLLMHDYTHEAIGNTKWVFKNHNAYKKLFEVGNSIFIAIPKDAFFLDAYYTEYEFLKNLWYKVFIWRLDQLTQKDDNIFFEWAPIRSIRRCIEVGKIEEWTLDLLTWAKVSYMNTFDMRLLWFKDNLSHIRSSLVPKTLILNTETKSLIVQDKDNWVIKPTNLFEWKWVYIGKDTNQDIWERQIQEAQWANYVAQEFVASDKIEMDFYENGTILTKEVYFDICPHFFVKNGIIQDEWITLVRFSENKILNIAQWWGLWYLQ